MAFPEETTKTPTTIGDIVIVLNFPNGGPKSANYSIRVHDQNGDIMGTRRGDLQPHLTANQITQIQNFLDEIRADAEDKILP